MTAKRHHDWLITNVRLSGADGPVHAETTRLNAIGFTDGTITHIGPMDSLEQQTGVVHHADRHLDGKGAWVTPGLIDCHTHLVFGGSRVGEFNLRMQGHSYTDIAARGGGILNTVNATRAASEEALYQNAEKRLRRLLNEGVTSVEIKSGYGLDLPNELKLLRVARRLGQELPVTVRTTYLAAHALPAEYRHTDNDQRQKYIDTVCNEMLPPIADSGLADAVDVFCEGVGFTPAQCEQIFKVAHTWQLPVKAHAEQLSDLGGAKLAAAHAALSVDHLEYLNPKDIAAIKAAGTVAVLLPGAYYFLRETRKPPVTELRSAGVPMAIATDLNPGTSPQASLLLAMNQACVLFGLTPDEALSGTTRHAAQALNLKQKGHLRSGMDADLCLWDIDHPHELAYAINQHQPRYIWQAGRHVKGS